MHMAEQLPHFAMRVTVAQEGMVIEEDGLIINDDVQLKCDLLEAFKHFGSQVIDVVVAHNQHNPSVELVKETVPHFSSAESEIAQVEHQVILADHTVPVLNERLVHLFNVTEGTIAVAQDGCVSEVGIRREKHVHPRERIPGFQFACLHQVQGNRVKSIVHDSTFCAPQSALVIKYGHQPHMTLNCCHSEYQNKKSGWNVRFWTFQPL